MANIFDEMIEEIMKQNGGKEDRMITALREKKEELGDDASVEDITKALQSCLMEHFSEADRGNDSDEPVILSEEDRECMKHAIASVKAFLDENKWHYSTRALRSDIFLYELSLGVENVNLRIRIHVEADPNVCRIDAVLPISADVIYEYPLCKVLAKENYSKRFGSYKYDERDGEISFRYSFLTRHGIFKDDLDTYFHAVIHSAVSAYDDIRKCCVGRFKSKEVNEILKKVRDLVSDIKE